MPTEPRPGLTAGLTKRSEGPEGPTTDLVDRLVQTSFAVVGRLNRVAAAHDLSLTQLRVLAILRDREPAMAALADHLGLERSSVSGLVDRAVRRGLVRRDTVPGDARGVQVSLTDEGRVLAARLEQEIGELLAPMVGRVRTRDRPRLVDLLGDLLG